MRPGRTVAAGLALGVVVVATVGACSADDTGPDIPARGSSASTSVSASASPTVSDSASATPTAEVVDGVPLTAGGTKLALGQTATVSFSPKQGETGVVDITVKRLEKTSFKKSFVGWDIPAAQQKAQPYFVRATVTNRGTSDLGRRPVPLYIVDATNTLIEATTFASQFKPCRPGAFPTSFPTGATDQVCLVYLAPRGGDLTAVSFRPTQKFDPITWTGDLKQPRRTNRPAAGASATASPTASPS